MEYRSLGKSGLKVSSLCLGTMTFGEADEDSFMHQATCDEATSFALMNQSLEAGINFMDTANVYGQDGLSERVIGNWFHSEKKRNQVVLATKFRFGMGPGPNDRGASRIHIVRAVEESLRRLQTDRIDLYQIHMQDDSVPEEELLRALDDLVRQGKVLYFGASNYTAYRLAESVGLSRLLGLNRFVGLQAQYNLVERGIERELVPACLHFGLGILPWSPLAAGFLSGKYSPGEDPSSDGRLGKWKDRYQKIDNERNWKILAAVREISAELDASPAQVALAWLLNRPAVTSVIIGVRTKAQLDDNLKATEIQLSESAIDRLDKASYFSLGYPYGFIRQIQGSW